MDYLDSIELVKISDKLETELGIKLHPTILFEAPTIAELTRNLADHFPDTLSKVLDLELSPVFEKRQPIQTTCQAKQKEPSAKRAIAIIGMSGIFPGADDTNALWKLLSNGKHAISEMLQKRWQPQPDEPDLSNEMNKGGARFGGLINHVDKFDHAFFGISPREAKLMDPQHRILLQKVWHAIEDAGYPASSLGGTETALFIGVQANDYHEMLIKQRIPLEGYSVTGNAHSILVNRLSYLLNFKGPSEPINTACSSSLVAICRAVNCTRNGHCDLAIAGGINLILTPTISIALNRAGMLSKDGRCKTFDESANGYVRGEGCGVLVLKSLSKAEEDGDNIHAIIRGGAVNHSGKTSSLTAPNPVAQSELLIRAWNDAGIDPQSLNYIETHGTGTRLGDPIEIEGLKRAINHFIPNRKPAEEKTQTCGLGSIKTNIGHLESAAGIAGVMKVILSMKNNRQPATLNISKLNPRIDLSNSPFYINRQTSDWKPLTDETGKRRPRRAGISSFGFGGVNCHLVVEEFIPLKESRDANGKQILVLSAKSYERLKTYAEAFAYFLEKTDHHSLSEIAWTMQSGREAMPVRLAFVAENLDEARKKLHHFLKKPLKANDLYIGTVPRKEPLPKGPKNQQEYGPDIAALIENSDFRTIARRWVQGEGIDWSLFYPQGKPYRISLPPYPFEKTRCWLQDDQPLRTGPSVISNQSLHKDAAASLNTTLHKHHFSGKEFFLQDHKVLNERVLPGAAHLEIVLRSFLSSNGNCKKEKRITFQNVTWCKPIIWEKYREGKDINVILSGAPNGHTLFQLVSAVGEDQNKQEVCSNGTITDTGPNQIVNPAVSTKRFKAQFDKGCYTSDHIYQAFEKIGLQYGPGHRGLEKLWIGKKGILAQLVLSSRFEASFADHILHPGILDSAWQALIGFMLYKNREGGVSVPCSLDAMQIVGRCRNNMWAHVEACDTKTIGNNLAKYNIYLYSEKGALLVACQGLALKKIVNLKRPEAAGMVASDREGEKTGPSETALTLIPRWENIGHIYAADPPPAETYYLVNQDQDKERLKTYGSIPASHIIDCRGPSRHHEKKLQTIPVIRRLVWLAPSSTEAPFSYQETIAAQERGLYSLFRIVKALLQRGYDHRAIDIIIMLKNVQLFSGMDMNQPTHAAIIGFAGTLAKEVPSWRIAIFDLPKACDPETFHTALFAKVESLESNLACRQGKWYRQTLVPLNGTGPTAQGSDRKIFLRNGCYLIVGGAGGIGEIVTQFLVKEYRAQVIWLGRRKKDQAIQKKIDKIGKHGPPPIYYVCDASDLESFRSVHHKIKKQFSSINGVVHAALDLQDELIKNMDEDTLRSVIASKLNSSLALASVFKSEPLDFMLFFSSLVSFAMPPGQSNYAAASRFLDTFAHAFNGDREYPVKTLNWGYWGSIGAVASDKYGKLMRAAGLGSIEPEEGISAIRHLLESPYPQLVYLKTLETFDHKHIDTTAFVQSAPEGVLGHNQSKPTKSELNPSAFWPQNQSEAGRLRYHEFESFLHQYLYIILSRNGYDIESNRRPDVFSSHYHLWTKTTIALLRRYFRTMRQQQPEFQFPEETTFLSVWEEMRERWLKDPVICNHFLLIQTTLDRLDQILRGECAATDVLFPDASMELVESIYKNNPVADYYNAVLIESLRTILDTLVGRQRSINLKILEIGAGTGGTSEPIFTLLEGYRNHIQEYCYTDVSKAFLFHAEKNYSKRYCYLKTALLNIENPITNQGLPLGEYDIVIAANVLHATRHIANTLRNTKALMKKNGLLLMNEISEHNIFLHLTFGLLKGWWLSKDSHIRMDGGPGLSSNGWEEALLDEGFKGIRFPAGRFHKLGQQIIIAASDGLIYQKKLLFGPSSSQRAPHPEDRQERDMQPFPDLSDLSKKELLDTAAGIFQRLIGYQLKMAPREIDIDVSLEQYGLDSLMIGGFAETLSAYFNNLTTAFFFEHQNIAAMVNCLAEAQPEALAGFVMEQSSPPSAPMESPEAIEKIAVNAFRVLIGRQLIIPVEEIHHHTKLDAYGLDSLMIGHLSDQLSIYFDNLTSAIFLEHETISSLVRFFAETQRDALSRFVQAHKESSVDAGAFTPSPDPQEILGDERPTGLRGGSKVRQNISVNVMSASIGRAPSDLFKTLASLFNNKQPYPSDVNKDLKCFDRAPSPNPGNHQLLHISIVSQEDETVEVISLGQGAPVVLIPGLGNTALVWLHQLIEFSKTNQVLVFHLPGHGRSRKTRHFSLDRISRQIMNGFEEVLTAKPVHLIGHSMGTMVVQHIASTYADRIASVTLSGGFYDMKVLDFVSSVTSVHDLPDLFAYHEGIDFSNVEASLEPSSSSEIERIRSCKEIVRKSRRINNTLEIMKLIETFSKVSTLSSLQNIQAPTLVVQGQKDAFVQTVVADKICAGINNVSYQEIPNAGHYHFLTHPHIFNNLVRRFHSETGRCRKI